MNKNHVKRILDELKQAVSAKYAVSDMRLFGSNARGDADENSDIDVYIQLPVLTEEIEKNIYNAAYDLELRYDCLIDVIMLSDEMIKKHKAQLPIYRSIIQDGMQA